MRCLYFGVWGVPGHHLVGPGGSRADIPNQERHDLSNAIDSSFAPRKSQGGKLCWGAQAYQGDPVLTRELLYSDEYPQGQFLCHRFGKWSLIQWWDRNQGDKRGACNSTILLEGDHNAQQILAAGRVAFPKVFENLARAGIELVEVHP